MKKKKITTLSLRKQKCVFIFLKYSYTHLQTAMDMISNECSPMERLSAHLHSLEDFLQSGGNWASPKWEFT